MAKNKHYIDMSEFDKIIDDEKHYLSTVTAVGYQMRNAAENIMKKANLKGIDIKCEEGSVDSLMELVDSCIDGEDTDDLTGLSFSGEKNGVNYLISTNCIPDGHAENGSRFFIDCMLIRASEEGIDVYNIDTDGWISISDTDAGRSLKNFVSMSEGEQQFYAMYMGTHSEGGVIDPEAGLAYVKSAGTMPYLYEYLSEHGTEAYATTAERCEGDTEGAPAVVVPESGIVVLQAPLGAGYDLYTFDPDESEAGWVTGLSRQCRCGDMPEVAKVVSSAFVN